MNIMGACENIGIVQFRRDLAFDKEFLLLAVPRIAGTLTTVAFALVFQNYWPCSPVFWRCGWFASCCRT